MDKPAEFLRPKEITNDQLCDIQHKWRAQYRGYGPLSLDQEVTQEVTQEAAAWREAILAAARERWPEMVAYLYIVDALPGKHTLLAPSATHIGDGERIELEQVGPYRLGYGPKSHILYVGQ